LYEPTMLNLAFIVRKVIRMVFFFPRSMSGGYSLVKHVSFWKFKLKDGTWNNKYWD
jgi:hypothetical protein